MADEIRSLAALQALLADNSVGSISPQDVRDMLVSLAVVGPAATMETPTQQATADNVWEKIDAGAGTFYDPGNGQFADGGVPNRIVNVSPNSVTFSVTCILDCSFDDVDLNDEIQLGIYHNGILLPNSLERTVGEGNNDPLSLTSIAGVTFAPGDTLEGWCRTPQDNDTVQWELVRLGFTRVTIT